MGLSDVTVFAVVSIRYAVGIPRTVPGVNQSFDRDSLIYLRKVLWMAVYILQSALVFGFHVWTASLYNFVSHTDSSKIIFILPSQCFLKLLGNAFSATGDQRYSSESY